jgi:carbonic anhydrase
MGATLSNVNGIGLAAAPHDLAGFADLGNAVVQSERIASHIK